MEVGLTGAAWPAGTRLVAPRRSCRGSRLRPEGRAARWPADSGNPSGGRILEGLSVDYETLPAVELAGFLTRQAHFDMVC